MEAYLLSAGHQVTLAANGDEALRLVREISPDLVLLDVMMPGISGYDVCAMLKADEATRLIPIILLTALGNLEDRLSGIEAGADEFLTKPCNRTELLTRIRTLTRVKRLNDQLESAENVLLALARVIEAKDPYTEGHVERVSRSARALGERLGLPRREVEMLAKAGFLHDIGKVGVRESVLLKPGLLTLEERKEIERHSVLGEEICRPLRSAANLLAAIRHHHERIDGLGYPDGLAGNAIPVAARVLAIVDAFDAMTSDRPYRPGMGADEALAVLRRYAGKQWNAAMVEVFADLIESSGAPTRA
jgi:putative two-component system response regulator